MDALAGIRVVDFSNIVAGPLCTRFLADHGAEVVWIENPLAMEIRAYTPFAGGQPGINRSAAYLMLGSGKRSLVLNLRNPKGLHIARRLSARADIVVEQFRPGTMEQLGLSYEELKRVKPDIIMLRISGQGQTGPWARQPGMGNILQSMLGFTNITGWPDRGPISSVIAPYPDYITAFAGVLLLTTALHYRKQTGQGQCLDLSIAEVGLQSLGPMLLDWTANEHQQERMGNALDRAAPHAVYRCHGDDRWCAIAVFDDEQWVALCRVIGVPDLADDLRFSTLLARKRNEDELNSIVEKWTVGHAPEQVMELMQAAGVPSGVWQDVRDINECAAFRERGFFQMQPHAEVGDWSWAAPPFRLSKTPFVPRPVPLAGQDNYYVCSELLGMTDEEFLSVEKEGLFDIP